MFARRRIGRKDSSSPQSGGVTAPTALRTLALKDFLYIDSSESEDLALSLSLYHVYA